MRVTNTWRWGSRSSRRLHAPSAMSGRTTRMLKFVMLPPQDDHRRQWAGRLAAALPQYHVVVAETEADARREIVDADGAYGWVPPDLLPLAAKLRWLQNPDAGPRPGYYYPELIEHPVVVCNPRGIYSDH